MAKIKIPLRFIFKIHSTHLKQNKWNLTLTLQDARKNDEVISLGDNQVLRWVDELNGIDNVDDRAREIQKRIYCIKSLPNSTANKKEIRRLYSEMDELLFKPDYMHLIIDKDKDLIRACKGFKINGIKYMRLLGTPGGVKNSTITFVSERLVAEIRDRINNGRDESIPQVPAKLEAYRALTCSGTAPVSWPNGILVVPDCETKFTESVITLDDGETDEPVMKTVDDYEVVLDESDGYGLMLPSLAERWSNELELDYTVGALCCRNSFTKGMLFTFDFRDFADEVAGGKHIVKDAWGNDIDITKVELVLTTSMLKLWKCYNSIEHYIECCLGNKYTFGVTKISPSKLENERATNYQYLQALDITDEQIDELIAPTIQYLKDIISDDYRKALLFLMGTGANDNTVRRWDADYVSALMIDKRMFNDPFVKRKIFQMIRKRIDDAKIGVINLHANYSLVCGDPYALCQSIFGLPVTGLLKAGEIYNKYWVDDGAKRVGCFRAPMSCPNNMKVANVVTSPEMEHWYQYIKTCTLINAWDSMAAALNGMDKDGDLVYLTDNKVVLAGIRKLPTIFCGQKSATKIEPSEDDLVRSNIASFGDDIGRITNYITSMYDVQAQFDSDSEEYKVLDYRIKCGQKLQQDSIDHAKGIECKPMPRFWYDRMACKLPDNPTEDDIKWREFNLRIVADRKPYFMRYIYPQLSSTYNKYVKNADIKCVREFGMDVKELMALPESELTEEQKTFIWYQKRFIPVSMNDCIVNRICRKIEKEFDGLPMLKTSEEDFDVSIMKSDAEYTKSQYYAVNALYKEHNKKAREYSLKATKQRMPTDDYAAYYETMVKYFKQECEHICSNDKSLCNIVIDLCYKSNGTKQFVWDMVSNVIIDTLLEKNNCDVSYPIEDPNGDIQFRGRTFSMRTIKGERYANGRDNIE